MQRIIGIVLGAVVTYLLLVVLVGTTGDAARLIRDRGRSSERSSRSSGRGSSRSTSAGGSRSGATRRSSARSRSSSPRSTRAAEARPPGSGARGRHSQRNVRAARSVGAGAPGREQERAAPNGSPDWAPSPIRSASDSAAAGSTRARSASSGRQVVDRQDDPAEEQERQEQAVGERQGRLGAQRAGHQQAEPGEGERPERERGDGRRRRWHPAPGAQPKASPATATSSTTWAISTTTTVAILAAMQPGPRQRRAAEPLEHAVRPLERGRDAEVDQARRDDREGEDPGQQERDPAAVDGRDEREEHEQDERHDDRHEQVLAAPARAAAAPSRPGRRSSGRRAGVATGDRASGGSGSSRRHLRALAGQLEIALLEGRAADPQLDDQDAALGAPAASVATSAGSGSRPTSR